MTPPGFENAPEWAQTLFYTFMALGAAYYGVKKIASGARDEARIVKATGRPSTVEEVIDAPERPRTSTAPAIDGFGIMGGSLINRQMAEDNIEVKRQLVAVLTRIEKLAERVLVIQEHRHERDEEDDRRDELRREALDLLKEMGVVPGENGVPPLGARPGRRPPRQG